MVSHFESLQLGPGIERDNLFVLYQAWATGMLYIKPEIMRLTIYKYAVAVYPAGLYIGVVVTHNEHIGRRNKLPIREVREKVRLVSGYCHRTSQSFRRAGSSVNSTAALRSSPMLVTGRLEQRKWLQSKRRSFTHSIIPHK